MSSDFNFGLLHRESAKEEIERKAAKDSVQRHAFIRRTGQILWEKMTQHKTTSLFLDVCLCNPLDGSQLLPPVKIDKTW